MMVAPVRDFAEAVIVAAPESLPMARPAESMVAMRASLDSQWTWVVMS